MNEMTKTLSFLGVGALAAALAFATRPGSVSVDAPDDINQALFESFTDPDQATSLKVTRFDEGLASLSEIEIEKANGLWTLPSHGGYPADAENKIRDATTPFIDLNSLAVVSDLESDHSLYGVLEPDESTTSVGDEGVGVLVQVRGEKNAQLVDLVIGKTVKDSESQRYVRRPGQSRVFIAEVDPDNLPVRFEDWIDKDLLDLNGFDISSLVLKDYSFEVAQSFTGPVTDFDQRLEMTVTDDGGTWNLDQLLLPNDGELRETELLETEELNQEKLGELKEALDGLEIVSVERKPKSLGADLRAGEELASDQAGLESLAEHGFYTVSLGPNQFEVLSADGEVLVQTKDGVEYVLRFGGVEGIDTEAESLKRYLLVSARVNEEQFPPVVPEPVPQTIDDLQIESPDDAGESDSDSAEANSDQSPVDGDEDGEEADDASTSDDASEASDDVAEGDADVESAEEVDATDDASSSDDGIDEANSEAEAVEAEADATEDQQSRYDDTATLPVLQEGDAATDAASDSEAADSDDSGNDDADADESDADDVSGDQDEANAAESASDGSVAGDGEDSEAEQVDLEKLLKDEQERITKENQRKIDERNSNLEKAQQKARELNYRFADWYYVISEDVYKKIHLSHSDIIKEKEADDESAAADGNAGSGIPPLNGLPE